LPGSLGHLSSRFFDVLLSRPLDVAERATVETWLTPALADVFFAQPGADQRHGYEAGLYVIAAGAEPDVVVAATMHDVGKRQARLGIVARVIASLLIMAGLPLTSRMQLYRDHGMTAAAELAALGAPPLAIDFALHHHSERPPSISPGTWDLLVSADQPKTAHRKRVGISSVAR
jgi:hypothetical protein